MNQKPLKLNLGCGSCYFTDGFVNIDMPQPNAYLASELPVMAQQNACLSSDPYANKPVKSQFPGANEVDRKPVVVDRFVDIRRLRGAYDPNSVDEVWMIQVLEHFSREDGERIARDICEILKPGGKFVLSVPDLPKTAEQMYFACRDGDEKKVEYYIRHLYGNQKNQFAFHLWGFSTKSLIRMLAAAGFGSQRLVDNFHFYPAIVIEAKK